LRSIVASVLTASCLVALDSAAYDGISLGLGLEYNPIARLEYGNNSQPGQDVVDNITLEPGIYIGFANGLRVGGFFTRYSKSLERGDNRTSSLSAWGIGFSGDYGLEITESGKTQLAGGIEAGYSELTDKNEFNKRTRGGIWVAAIGGIRHFINRAIFLEMNFRMKWLEYDFPETPQKSYDYSGPVLRISLGYGVYAL